MTTLGDARRAMYRQAGIADDGGDSQAWVDFKLGFLPMPFPNTDARRRAVKFHDLHHVLTGYATDIIGEFEIAAWEVASGCGRFVVPWHLNLMGVAAGLLVVPRRTWAAFRRGAVSKSLYRFPDAGQVEHLEVEVAKRQLAIPSQPPEATNRMRAQLLAASVAGAGLMALTGLLILTPVTFILWVLLYAAYRRRRRASS
jgi:hypothetical protein